ncbi:MAG: hypothetical protein AABZ02_12540 [Bacteroidota bacterium]
MTEKQKEQLRQKWRSWLDEIGNELGWLLTGRDFFWRLQRTVESNKKIQSPAILHNWIADNYVAKVATGIRKMVDKKESVSLYRLIWGIKKNPDVITREYFVSQWRDEFLREMGTADRTFDVFAKAGEERMDPERLDTALGKLDEGTCLVKHFTDKWVAHWDKNRENAPMPTFGDLDRALDTIDGVWCEYRLLLERCAPDTRKPAMALDWEAPLRHRWIEEPEQAKSEG